MTVSRFDADHFALHGLWPDDDYCAVSAANEDADRSGRWSDLPAPNLSASTRAALDQAMPGTQSMLERHEWIKHGSCARATADAYFARAVALLAEINASAVRELFAGNLGQSVTQGDIRTAFDDAFGRSAGSRVRVACERDGNRRIVTELTIGLYGDVMGSGSLADLIAAARPTDGGCDSGVVDRVGGQ
jgi:ribonuclease T2